MARPTLHAKQPEQTQAPVAAAPVATAPAPAPEAPAQRQEERVLPAPTPELNPRNRAMAEIAQRANEDADRNAQETMGGVDGEETIPPVNDPDETPIQAPAAPAAEAAAPAQTPETEALGIQADGDYEFVIDGVKTKVKGSQIVAQVQKAGTADYRLELASKLLEEAKQQAARQAQPPRQGAAQAPRPAQQVPELNDEELAHLIQFGTKEQAAAAVRSLKAQRPGAVTQQEFAAIVAQFPGIVEQRLAFREGVDFVQREYGDLLADPYLKQLFIAEEQKAIQAADKRSKRDLYRAIGDDLRKHFNRPAPAAAVASAASAPTPQAAPTIAEKQAAKAQAPAAPKLASVRLDGAATAKPAASREQILDQMRTRRGQASMTNR